MEPKLREELQSILAVEKERLERELASFAKKDPHMAGDWDTVFPSREFTTASASPASLDEQADMREEFETELAQEYSLESRLVEVTGALERINGDSYGRCKACGQSISEERLRANPAAEYDIAHQPKEG